MAANLAEPGTGGVPVLRDIVEIRVGPDGRRVSVPLDLEQLTDRIVTDLIPRLRNDLRNEMHKELHRQLDACLDQTLDTALQQIRREVRRTLLAQLGDSDL